MPLRTYEPQPKGEDTELDRLIDRYAGERGATIPLLQALQDLRGYLPEDDLVRVSARTGIPVSRLLGVATFYSQFRLKPIGRHLVRVCHGTACHVAGTAMVQQAVEDELQVASGGTTPDGSFTLEKVACLGCCSLAPAMVVDTRGQGEQVHARLTPDKARRIIRRMRRAETKEPARAEAEATTEEKP